MITPAHFPKNSPFILRATDLKQFEYCPRVVFYHYVMPLAPPPSFKMLHGQSAEARIDQLEKRRTVGRYRLQDGQRHFHVQLESEVLGLRGKVDLLIESSKGCFPVDFKETQGSIRINHRLQLCAYALLIEEAHHCTVPHGYIFFLPSEHLEVVPITSDLRNTTLKTMDIIRQMICSQQMPPPTSTCSRCCDCEFRNFCGDI